MGAGESRTRYETVDKTDPYASDKGQRQAQEENQKRLRELQDEMAREHKLALRDAQERARCEDENQRKILDRQRREREERERKIKEEEKFFQVKDALMNYDFQTCPRIRKESFRDLDVGDVDFVRIALIGPTGSGKTSFVGTIQRALGNTRCAFVQGKGKEGAILLEEYCVQEKIRLVNVRGFLENDRRFFEECLENMFGRIRPDEESMEIDDPGRAAKGYPQSAKKAQELAKYVHAVIFVVKANDPRLRDNNFKKMMTRFKEHCRDEGYAPVTVITHLDMLKDEGDKETAFDMASWATGSSSERTYFIANYTHEKSGFSLEVERTALDILEHALISAERFIRIRKQREKNQMEREVAAGGASSREETLEQFFARLRMKYNLTDRGNMKNVLPVLRSKGINTVKALTEVWRDVKPELPLSIGLRRIVEEEMKEAALAARDSRPVFQKTLNTGLIPEKPNVESAGLVTSKGGVVAAKDVQVVCPPGAVDNPVTIKITLEEPFRHYGQIVSKGLESDVIFASPIIRLQPNGQLFKKAVSVKTRLRGDMGNIDSYRILHGTQDGEGKLHWEDVTHASKIDLEQKEVTVQIDKFSLVAALMRLTFFPLERVASLLNLLSFKYTMSVLFKNNHPLTPYGELSFLFMKQDIYRERFYSKHVHCALKQLKQDGFKEVCFSVAQESSYPVYDNEYLEVSVHLGEDYKLAESDQNVFGFNVDSSLWQSAGHVVKLSLQGVGSSDVRIVCGRVNLRGQYGHSRDGSFSDSDKCGYVKRLLGAEGAAINITPIAQKLEVPEETVGQIIQQSWQKDDEQLEKVLHHWVNKNGSNENLAALKSALKGLSPKDYSVKERGQMHIEHLRESAKTIIELKHEDAEQMKYFAYKIQMLCPGILRDCCIEMASSREDVEMAASTEDSVRFLEIHRRISEDFASYIQRMSSPCLSSVTGNFLSIVPRLIQLVKEMFRDERAEVVQNGLKGLPEEEIRHLTAEVRNAEKHSSIPKMLCEACKVLEKLCLNNCGSHSSTQIQMWGNSLQSVCLLKLLKTFFQSCEDSKLYARLELLLGSLREIMSNLVTVDEIVVRDFYDVSLSLLNFAKFVPSKLVRFELIGPANSPLNSYSEALRYDMFCDTFSQQFHVRKDSDASLELSASAHVNTHGRVGAFASEIILPASAEPIFDRLIAGVSVEVKKEFEGSGNQRVILCSTQKENVSQALNLLQREIGVEDWHQTEITKVPLTVRTFANAGAVVKLRLLYKWQSEAIGLDSKDFVALAESSSERTSPLDFQRTATLLPPSSPLVATQATLASASMPSCSTVADGVDPSPLEVIQRHAHKQFERLEIHYHQSVIQGHNCVVGNDGSINTYRPNTDRGFLQGSTSGTSQRSVTAPPSSQQTSAPSEDTFGRP